LQFAREYVDRTSFFVHDLSERLFQVRDHIFGIFQSD
jgi:hypothetical protein